MRYITYMYKHKPYNKYFLLDVSWCTVAEYLLQVVWYLDKSKYHKVKILSNTTPQNIL